MTARSGRGWAYAARRQAVLAPQFHATPERTVQLYRVTADRDDYDQFSEAVVYAYDDFDAIEIVRAECGKNWSERSTAGVWYPIQAGAILTAEPVQAVRGAVLGHGHAG